MFVCPKGAFYDAQLFPAECARSNRCVFPRPVQVRPDCPQAKALGPGQTQKRGETQKTSQPNKGSAPTQYRK